MARLALRSIVLLVFVACASAEEAAVDAAPAVGSVDVAPAGEAGAPPAGCAVGASVEGVAVGEVLPDVPVRRCSGEFVGLRELTCGHTLTLLDIGTAVEPDCRQATDVYVFSPDYVAMKAQGLNIVQVFRQDDDGDVPTKTWCSTYVEDHGVDFEFLTDPFLDTSQLGLMIPANLIVDQDARVVDGWVGKVPDDKIERLQALLSAARR